MKRLCLLGVLIGCTNTPDERADLDLLVGVGSADDVTFTVDNGHAAVREIGGGRLELWAQAPTLTIAAERGPAGPSTWTVVVHNCMPAAELRVFDSAGIRDATFVEATQPTERTWSVELVEATSTLFLAPSDAGSRDPFTFLALADVQDNIGRAGDIIELMNEVPGARFVIAPGDLTQNGTRDQLIRYQDVFEALRIPYFATVGNHELFANTDDWHELFGLHNLHFEFKGAHFTLIDTGSARVAESVYDRLAEWIEETGSAHHTFACHIPPIDPIGVRDGAFNSRREANRLLSELGRGGVDLTLYGHIHSYYGFQNGGIEAHISGGGGGIPEKLDGIGRHFLSVDVEPLPAKHRVAVVRVD